MAKNTHQVGNRLHAFGRRVTSLLGWCLALALPSLAAAEPERVFVVLREHGTGAASRAQPYLDQLLKVVAKKNAWSNASGKYFAERAPALEFIRTQQPEFGILSLDAFLALRGAHELGVLGEVVAPKAGGLRYYVVSSKANKLEGCRGQRLVTTFVSDPKFVERVVAAGAFKLGDFKLVEARRPLEPLKRVLRDEAECALVDDAQFDAAKHIEQGNKLKAVWQSAKLPGMVVVKFAKADAASTSQLKASLAGVCAAAGEACSSVGIEQLRPTTEATYRQVIDAYAK